MTQRKKRNNYAESPTDPLWDAESWEGLSALLLPLPDQDALHLTAAGIAEALEKGREFL